MEEVNIKGTGDTYTSTEFNDLPLNELQNMITNTGLTFNANDLTQLSQAVNILSAEGLTYLCSGPANTYALSEFSSTPLTAYFNGMTVIFLPSNANTAASTLNVSTLGVINLLDENGVALTGGELVVNLLTRAVYFNGDFYLEPVLSSDTNLKNNLANQTQGSEGSGLVGHTGTTVNNVECRAFCNYSNVGNSGGKIIMQQNIINFKIIGSFNNFILRFYFDKFMTTVNYIIICSPRLNYTRNTPYTVRYSNLQLGSFDLTITTSVLFHKNIALNFEIYEAR